VDFGGIGNLGLLNLSTTATANGGVWLNPSLLNFFGLSGSTEFSILSLQLSTGAISEPPFAPAPFSVSVFSTDWQAVEESSEENAQSAATPEPMTLLLVGSGASLMAVRRRRKSSTQGEPSC